MSHMGPNLHPKFKIVTMSRPEACNIRNRKTEKRLAIISITNTQISPANLTEECFDYILRVKFDDVDGPRFGQPISEENANQIIEFVEDIKNDIDYLIVHCQAGQSRSPGVAVALNEIYNNDKFIMPKWIHYNKLVYRTVLNHYYENYYEEE